MTKKNVPTVQIICGSGALNQPTTLGQPGDRGCVSCGTILHGEWYVSGAAYETVIVDGRGRYWCLDCAASALMNVRRRVDDRTDYDYPWRFEDTGGLVGQHARVRKVEGAKQCPKCGVQSGDDWRQCEGSCPMPSSPHYNESCAHAFKTNPIYIPAETLTRMVKDAADAETATETVHVLTQDGQPYGSQRRCCNHCGIMLWPGVGSEPFYVDCDQWRADPNNCGKKR